MAFLLALVASNLSVVLAVPQGVVGGLVGGPPQCPQGTGGLLCCRRFDVIRTPKPGAVNQNDVDKETIFVDCIYQSLSECLSGLALMEICRYRH